MSYNFEVKTFEKTAYIGIYRKAIKPQDMGAVLGDVLPKVAAFLQEKGVTPTSPPLTFYYCHDEETCTFDLRGGFFLAEKIEGSGDIECGEIEAGEVVSTMHVGAYDNLGQTHQAVNKWIQEQGRESSSPCWEMYLSDPGKVKPEECQTQVVYRLG